MKLKKNVKIFLFITTITIISIVLFNNFSESKLDNKNEETTTTTSKVKETKKELKLTLIGDLLFESPFYNAINSGYDSKSYFSLVKDYFMNDDITLGNMEVPIGNESMKTSGDGYNFCAPSSIGDLISSLDFEVLSTANNHSYDRGINGLKSTLEYFNNTKIKTVGTYLNDEDRKNNRIIEVNGIKVGFLAYTLGTNQTVEKENRNLIGLYRDPATKTMTDEYKTILTNEISNLRSKCDVLIVMMHWGTEFTFTPSNEQKEMAKFLNSLNVDIIYGSHSHSIQPIEIIGNDHKTLVYYSLGNFVSADDDIARTPPGNETFDNAYNFGLLSTITLEFNDNIEFTSINTIPVVNYFDTSFNNFLLIPFDQYNENYEKTHLRYNKGLTKEFIKTTFENTINSNYR